MIKVDRLTKTFGPIRAVSDVSFSVNRGEILGFLGPNGAGKTTTMRMLCGIFPPTSGHAVVAGFDVAASPMEVRKRIGYLPEQIPLYPELTVAEYLDFVTSVWGFNRDQKSKAIGDVLDRCGLYEVENARLGRLSRGYRQRVGLAQALVHDPEVLILDEPTVGLDPKQIREIREFIKSMRGSKTIILSTHILPEVSMTCDQVVIIDQGKLVAEGTPESLGQSAKSGTEIEVEVAGPSEEISSVLGSLPGAEGVKLLSNGNGGLCKFAIALENNHDIRPEIARVIVEKNWGLFQMSLRTLTLEDVFVKLVTHEETP